MKAIYFDCFSGVSGDMILGALVDAGLKLADLKREWRKIPLRGYCVTRRAVRKQGFPAAKIDLIASDKRLQPPVMVRLIKQSRLAPALKDKIIRLIKRLAQTEARVHGVKTNAHLHELGSADTLLDISGAIIGLHLLGIEKVYTSPLPIFRGYTTTAHGRIPLPAPATAALLTGFPVYYVDQTEEIVTPTGALILTSLAEPVPQMPTMTISKIAYGSGDKELPGQPNLLRAFVGEISHITHHTSHIWVLETNLDNLSPEIIGYVFEKLLTAGALDVWILPVQMKKSRPGILLSVLTEETLIPTLEKIIFSETTTLGIRRYLVQRTVLEREIKKVSTKYGPVRVKVGRLDGVVINIAPEYEDCRRLAERHNISLKSIYHETIRRMKE